jgi:hypothetical protein
VPDYVQQFDRVKRFLARIENQNRGSTEYDDDLWAFFQNCWHLKDWVENDSTISATVRQSIWSDVKSKTNLTICADLANRTKHSVLDHHWFDAKFTQRNVTVYTGTGTSTSEHIITLKDGTKVVALDVARAAVKEWQEIFTAYGL